MNRRTRNLRISILVILVLIFMKYCGISAFRHFSERNLSREEIKAKMKLSQKDYLSIFPIEQQNKLRLDALGSEIFITKSQHPILSFFYGGKPDLFGAGGDFEVIIQKVDFRPNQSLNNLIVFEKKEVNRNDEIYAGIGEEDDFKIRYSRQHDSIVKKIYLTFDGDLLKASEAGDSIINFNINTQKMSLGYEKNYSGDILLETGKTKENFTVSFYKKNSSIYTIIIKQCDKKISSEKYLINDLIGRVIL